MPTDGPNAFSGRQVNFENTPVPYPVFNAACQLLDTEGPARAENVHFAATVGDVQRTRQLAGELLLAKVITVPAAYGATRESSIAFAQAVLATAAAENESPVSSIEGNTERGVLAQSYGVGAKDAVRKAIEVSRAATVHVEALGTDVDMSRGLS